jgi:hypothetical protein
VNRIVTSDEKEVQGQRIKEQGKEAVNITSADKATRPTTPAVDNSLVFFRMIL